MLFAHPKKLVQDVTVAGVSGGRTLDEKIPRAWVVLSREGKKLGAAATIKELEAWHQENLSKYKWLRGGIEVVKEVPLSLPSICHPFRFFLILVIDTEVTNWESFETGFARGV